MPTLPNEPEPEKFDKELGDRLAKAFGAGAARYDRTRPPYPDELVERVVTASPGPRVVDVGCGTGTLSRQLIAAGCEVVGVEHDELMAGVARETGVPVEVSKFETWDPAGREFDAVVAGQSWHWVDPEQGPRQAARVLRPGGVFVALWHVFSTPDSIAQALADTYQRVAPDASIRVGHSHEESLKFYQWGCERTAEKFVATGEFTELGQWSADWDKTYTTDEYLDLILTMSPIALLTEEQTAEILDSVRTAIDTLGGSFTSNYRTLAVAVTRN
ncbi:class I SAM-dependent methyltransferase [Lentzea flava]|uniref:Methyltransferase type 11 n=1 Tax=Lentzea flava TaxID=103732 RepID=A0ABQ2UT54_9PSEU|nr:class I SAM-dependent methyltransferase [Lentzea flava]MCP2201485.1 Ubiquinone/menaquinone biosynthesis C-methylase UbiE [Lentzea flava]GGU52549.1 methyltransferase type 11 [Lentzea flava]